MTQPVVASVVASAGQTRAPSDVRRHRPRHLLVASPPRGEASRQVNVMTVPTRLAAVYPTPTGVIRAVEERLDALERDVHAAREALAAAEAELLAAQRNSEVQPEALTTDQVARVLGLSRSTVTTLISRGELVSVKIGGARRVLRRDLDAYLAALTAGGAA